jgi:hypothetical protein
MPRKPRSDAPILSELLKGTKRWKALLQATGLSKATLTNSLRRLRKNGLVEPVLVDDEVHWQLSTEGQIIALEGIGRGLEVQDLKRATFSVTVQELHSNAWWDLINQASKSMEIEKYRPKDQSREDFEKILKSYCNQIKPVVSGLWPDLVQNVVYMVGSLLATLIVISAFLPSPLDEKSRKALSHYMTGTARPISEMLERQIRETLLANFNYLEALVILDKAVGEGKVSAEEFEGKPPDEVIRMLQQKGLLEVIEVSSDKK